MALFDVQTIGLHAGNRVSHSPQDSDSEWSVPDWRAFGIATHRHFFEVTSTNDVARDLSTALPDDRFPLLITCVHQTKGRGRHGRQWSHSSGGLACSIAVRLGATSDAALFRSAQDQHRLSIWTAVCLHETAQYYLPRHSCRIKWPNDLMIDDRKNAGILIEPVPGRPLSMVVGIGVNINNVPMAVDGTASDDRFSWTESAESFSVPEVLAEFLRRWLAPQTEWPPAIETLHAQFAAADWLHGKRLEVLATGFWKVLPNGELQAGSSEPAPGALSSDGSISHYTGEYVGLDPRGYLKLRTDAGELWVFPSVERVRTLP